MILPLFLMKNGSQYSKVTPKITAGGTEYEVSKFIKLLSDRFSSEPERLEKKDPGFLTVAAYIMLEILHRTNPGLSIDDLTSLSGKDGTITLQQAAILFAVGMKVGQSLPEGTEIESKVLNFDLWDQE